MKIMHISRSNWIEFLEIANLKFYTIEEYFFLTYLRDYDGRSTNCGMLSDDKH